MHSKKMVYDNFFPTILTNPTMVHRPELRLTMRFHHSFAAKPEPMPPDSKLLNRFILFSKSAIPVNDR